MSTAAALPADATESLRALLDRQKRAFRDDPMPSADVRRERLKRFEQAVLDRREDLVAAVREDFSARSRYETLIADVMTTVRAAEHLRKHLGQWMRPEKRFASLMLAPSRAWIHVQPKGVIGVLAPWNYPIYLGLVPVATALAAGNRAMLKPSEFTPRTSALLADVLSCFDDDLVAVVQGGPDVGATFTGLPFDHLVFTGSTSIGRKVARAAADNLVPLTLELGGKSPALVHPSEGPEKVVGKIVAGKLFNAGQTCIAPDYALIHRPAVDAFVAAFRAEVGRRYPSLRDNDDYTAIINERHLGRLRGVLGEAASRGATVVEVNPASEDLSGTRKLAPHVVIGAPDDTSILQDEIFGPILPIVPYDTLDEALAYVNDRPRPLAMYYFDQDGTRCERVLDRTHAGGMCLNHTLLHIAVDDMPFGGIGPSGMGAVHGREGFDSLSHRKSVYSQSRIDITDLLTAPFRKSLDRLLPILNKLG